MGGWYQCVLRMWYPYYLDVHIAQTYQSITNLNCTILFMSHLANGAKTSLRLVHHRREKAQHGQTTLEQLWVCTRLIRELVL